jgi:hypothetical protein
MKSHAKKKNPEEVTDIQGKMGMQRIVTVIEKMWVSHNVPAGEVKYVKAFISYHLGNNPNP